MPTGEQKKACDGVYRELAGAEHVQLGGKHYQTSRHECASEIRPQSRHSRPRLVRVPLPVGVQAGMERWHPHDGAAPEHQPHLLLLQSCVCRQPAPHTGSVQVCCVWLRGKRRCRFGSINILRAGHARCACEVSGEIMPPVAGTHRSDSGTAQCRT